MWILIVGGFTLGCASAGAVGCYMLYSRPYRKARNRIVIHSGQAFVLISFLGGLLLLQDLEQHFSIPRHSSSYYAAMYAHVLGLVCVVFFVLRAEFRWRRSVGLVTSPKSNRPVAPGAYRKLLTSLGILAPSICFSVAYWVSRPKPISVIFVGISLLFVFAAMIFLGRGIGGAQMREMRTVIFVLAAALFCMFGGLAWKFRKTDVALSSAWLAALAVPCVAALTAFFFMRPRTDTGPES